MLCVQACGVHRNTKMLNDFEITNQSLIINHIVWTKLTACIPHQSLAPLWTVSLLLFFLTYTINKLLSYGGQTNQHGHKQTLDWKTFEHVWESSCNVITKKSANTVAYISFPAIGSRPPAICAWLVRFLMNRNLSCLKSLSAYCLFQTD